MRPTVCFTDIGDGSFALGEPADVLASRRQRVAGRPVAWLRQVHGSEVVVVDPDDQVSGRSADALVTSSPNVALSVITADCAPVLLTSDHAVAAVHAGWRGLHAGVLAEAVGVLRAQGATAITAWLGPCIRTRCYEFGEADLEILIDRFGPQVRGETSWGTPALDVAAGVRIALSEVGVEEMHDSGVCTACSPTHFSHRARRDTGRQAAFVWLER